MKIYTKSGDEGKTGLFHGPRVNKDDERIEAYGTVDELSSVIGLARTEKMPEDMDVLLARIQHNLFSLGAELATPDPGKHGTTMMDSRETHFLEEAIDCWDGQLEPLANFILPGGTRAAAALHHARVVCRRAERRVVTLSRAAAVSAELLAYLNRLGDLLFVLARSANASAGLADVPWQQPD